MYFEKKEDEEEEPLRPEEGDLVTEDHVKFYQYGNWRHRPAFEVKDGEDVYARIKEYQDDQKFWGTVWFLSDHGDYYFLITDQE